MSSSRVGTQTNLQVGGTYDLLLVKFSQEYPEGQITFGLYDTPMKITGVQKVAQQFLRTLLTTKGSDPFYPAKGTSMPGLMVGANITKDNTLLLADISDAVKDASQQTRSMLNVNTEDLESSLDIVEVIGVDTVDEGWFVALRLLTLAGVGVEIAVPFPEFGLPATHVGDGVLSVTVLPPTPVRSAFSGAYTIATSYTISELPPTPVRSAFSGAYTIATPYTISELTSYLYPTVSEDSMFASGGFTSGSLLDWGWSLDGVGASSSFVSGSLGSSFQVYNNGGVEEIKGGGSFVSGSLVQLLLTYNDGAAEAIQASSSLVSGDLAQVLLSYSNGVYEQIQATSSFVSGTLT